MRVLLILLSCASLSLADDRSFCEGECAKKFKDQELKSACSSGCPHRGSISDGSRGFVVCHEACAAAHPAAAAAAAGSNETAAAAAPEGGDQKRAACDYACSLPVTNIVMMKVDYGTGDAAPRVQVVRKEGGDILGSDIGLGPDFDQLIMRPNTMHSGLLAGEGVKDDKADMSQQLDLVRKMMKIPAMAGEEDEEFSEMQNRLDEMVKSFFNRAHMTSRLVDEEGRGEEKKKEEEEADQKPAKSRPHTTHELFDILVPGLTSVGNIDDEGNELIHVEPYGDRRLTDLRDFEERQLQQQYSFRRRFPVLFQWSVFLVLITAIFCTMLIGILMLRQMRVNRYRALRSQAAASAAATMAAPMPLLEAGELVKKLPLDEEDPYPAPEGVPPPAYDQLSVHSKKGAEQ